MGKTTLPTRPGAILGYRKNGAPIRLQAGGDGTDDKGNDPTRLTHKQAVNRLKDIRDECERIAKKETRTGEDDRNFAEMVAEADVLDKHIRHLEREADLARVRKIVDEPRTGSVVPGDGSVPVGPGVDDARDRVLNPDSVRDRRFRNPYDLSEMRSGLTPEEAGAEYRARAISAIERFNHVDDRRKEVCTRLIERWDSKDGRMSQLLLHISSEEYVRAFGNFVAAQGSMAALTHDEQRMAQRAIAISPDSAGGFLVPFQLDPAVINTADGSLNEVRRVARQVVAIGDKWNGVSSAGVTSRWAGEATPASNNAPSFAQPDVEIHKLDIFVPISIEASQDALNIAQEVSGMIAFEADRRESVAFVTGTGTGQPRGIRTALNAAGGSVIVNTAENNAFAVDDVYELDSSLPARYRMAASWLSHRRTYNDIRGFDESGGSSLWVQLQQDVPPLLLGRRAYEAEEMATGTTTGTDLLIFGDWSNYVVADRIGTTVEFIPHLFRQETAGAGVGMPTGQRGWYAYKRVGANSVNSGAFRMLRVAGA
jgi:HK97 family phage major capsid protein